MTTDTTYVDFQPPAISAAWLNDVNAHVNSKVTSLHPSSDITYTLAGTGALVRTVQAKLRENISVLDFGADPTGATDSTAAVQAAFNYAITNGFELEVIGTFLLTGTVHIVKASGDFTPTYISGGGTFKKVNSGAMFDATNNATSEIFFNSIRFLGNGTSGSKAFICGQQLIRSYFTNCAFYNLDICFDSTAYLMQSFRFSGCVFGDILSWVIDCGVTGGFPIGSAFDVSFSQCQIEGQPGGLFRGSGGVLNVHDCVIENIISQPVFYLTNGSAINITGNYFEDCEQGIVVFSSTANCSGIVIQGNQGNLYTGTKLVVWGKTLAGCNTIGNSVNGGQTNDTSQVTSGYVAALNDANVGLIADGSAAHPVALKEVGTFIPTVIGGSTAGTCTSTTSGTYTKTGNVVTFSVDVVWSGHTGTGAILIGNFPYPPKNIVIPVSVIPNGITLPAGKVLCAAFLDGGGHVFLITSPTDGASGTYGQLSLASYTSGGAIVSGSYLTP